MPPELRNTEQPLVNKKLRLPEASHFVKIRRAWVQDVSSGGKLQGEGLKEEPLTLHILGLFNHLPTFRPPCTSAGNFSGRWQ